MAALTETTAYALASATQDLRSVVASAREHAWQARLAAARAAEAATQFPEALTWPKAHAMYSGETRNRLPHGHGVIVFRNGEKEVARYAGGFNESVRAGHGIATSDEGHVWTGQWSDGEASAEAPDGARFEGEVKPDGEASPRQVRGWTWDAPGAARTGLQPHRAVTPTLPSPQSVKKAAGG